MGLGPTRAMTIFHILAALMITVPKPEIPSIPRLKAAIKAVENTPRKVIGPARERSEYQILEATWKMWSLKPFEWASEDRPECVAETDLVMAKHLAYIRGILVHGGWEHTPYFVGCIYKGGETRWRENRLRKVDTDYARRLSNLYYDQKRD